MPAAISEALRVTVIGLVAVFTVILVFWAAIKALLVAFPVRESFPVSEPAKGDNVAADNVARGDFDDDIAAIMAVVAAMEPSDGLAVTIVKRA